MISTNLGFIRPRMYKAIALFSIAVGLCACGGGSHTMGNSGTTPIPTPVSPSPETPIAGDSFYVSSEGSDANNDGSQASPWATIQYGVDRLTAGQTLFVMPGIYAERVRLEGRDNSGNADAPLMILAEPGAIIDGADMTPAGEDPLLTLEDVSNVIIDGFEIRNFKTEVGFRQNSTPIGILVTGTSDQIEVNNNTVKYIENNSTCSQSDDCGPGANGIAVYGRTQGGVTNISFSGNEVAYNKTSSSEAFVLNGNVNGFTIADNYVHDNNNIGIDLIGLEGQCGSCSSSEDRARNGVVIGNRVIHNSTQNLGGNPWYQGSTSAGGIYVDGGNNIIIDRNFVSENDIGIEVASEASGQLTSDVIVRNNVIFRNVEAGLLLGGYNANVNESGGGGVTRILVSNNSLYKNRGWGTELTLQYRVTDSQFYNNAIFASGDVSEGAESTVSGDLSRADLVFMNNLWWADGSNDGAPVNPSSSLVSNPLFVDPENGELSVTSNSPLINSGETLADNLNWSDPYWAIIFPTNGEIFPHGLTDYSGSPRQVDSIDIGAHERQ